MLLWNFMKPSLAVVILAICLSCSRKQVDLHPAIDSINSTDLLAHIKTLSSDEYEGRSPGTHGEDLTVAYLTGQFKKTGLKPGNPDGTYVQKVPLVGYRSDTKADITARGRRLTLTPRTDYVASSRRFTDQIKVPASDIVFVGYGVVAPEYGWDDYKQYVMLYLLGRRIVNSSIRAMYSVASASRRFVSDSTA